MGTYVSRGKVTGIEIEKRGNVLIYVKSNLQWDPKREGADPDKNPTYNIWKQESLKKGEFCGTEVEKPITVNSQIANALLPLVNRAYEEEAQFLVEIKDPKNPKPLLKSIRMGRRQ